MPARECERPDISGGEGFFDVHEPAIALEAVRGEVVGMNTAIYSDARQSGNIGIGFAVPINAVRDLLPQLRTGKITRGMIGVSVGAIPRAEAAAWLEAAQAKVGVEEEWDRRLSAGETTLQVFGPPP